MKILATKIKVNNRYPIEQIVNLEDLNYYQETGSVNEIIEKYSPTYFSQTYNSLIFFCYKDGEPDKVVKLLSCQNYKNIIIIAKKRFKREMELRM